MAEQGRNLGRYSRRLGDLQFIIIVVLTWVVQYSTYFVSLIRYASLQYREPDASPGPHITTPGQDTYP